MTDDAVREMLNRQITPEEYGVIRKLWMKHSIAEDSRDLPGLMSTLTEDCVYHVVQSNVTWRGHEGATRFYTELLTAFPDIKFNLIGICIGPQGVWEEAHVTGTHKAQWLTYAPTGKFIHWKVVIMFPWVPEAGLFSGERIYVDTDEPFRTGVSVEEYAP